MKSYTQITQELRESPRKWLVTGVAGFIGSHLAENLLALGQAVVGLDDLSSGKAKNLAGFKDSSAFTFVEGNITDPAACQRAAEGAEIILHHAAIGSVVKSFEEPELVDAVNRGGFVNILEAAKAHNVSRVVYASSSAVYGDGGEEPRTEVHELQPKSPYAEGKIQNEKDAAGSGLFTVGLRYFNIFGARQDANGAYAAVIPRWIETLSSGGTCEIYGDGKTVRDFCFVDDVVQANILAACLDNPEIAGQVYNVGSGRAITLNELYRAIAGLVGSDKDPVYKEFRQGDIRVSVADITKAQNDLGFAPETALAEGLAKII